MYPKIGATALALRGAASLSQSAVILIWVPLIFPLVLRSPDRLRYATLSPSRVSTLDSRHKRKNLFDYLKIFLFHNYFQCKAIS